MKKIFSTMFLACSMTLAAADPYFHTATKNVDMNGEMLNYRNLTAVTAFVQNELPDIFIRVMESSGKAQLAPQDKAAWRERGNFILNLLDLTSFKAVAASSVKISPDLYVAKNSLVIAPESKSILLNKNVKNKPLDYMSLPADTRLALAGEIDLGSAWQQIKLAAAKSADPETRQIINSAEALKMQGFDLDALFSALNGRFSVLLAGDDALTMRFKVELPDKNGALSALLKRFLPPAPGSNQAALPLPMPSGVPPMVIYAENTVILASDAAVLAKPAQTLASLPKFREFAKHLPPQGCSYIVCNIPQGATDTVNTLTSLNPDMPKLELKPFAFIAVGRATESGSADTVVSDFSFAQLDIAYLKSFMPMIINLQPRALMDAQRR